MRNKKRARRPRSPRRQFGWLLAMLAALSMLLTACGGGESAVDSVAEGATNGAAAEQGYTKISPAELTAMLASKDFPLINVHIPYEGEIAATDVFIPYNEIGNHLGELPADRSTKVVLYCRSGRMSELAASELVRLGYTNVWELDGGMIAWQAAGYELVHTQP